MTTYSPEHETPPPFPEDQVTHLACLAEIPREAIEALGPSGIADVGEDFNATCTIAPGLQRRRLVSACGQGRDLTIRYVFGGRALQYVVARLSYQDGRWSLVSEQPAQHRVRSD